MKRPPRPLLKAILLVGGFEILDNLQEKERHPKVVDFAVEKAKHMTSPREAGLVNAVLRKFPHAWLEARQALDPSRGSDLALALGHPEWLVARWVDHFGMEITQALLQWNQRLPEAYLHIHKSAFQAESRWPGFMRVDDIGWEVAIQQVKAGTAYIQDPATRLAIELANVQPEDTVLDLCSAPGGKSWALMQGKPKRLVSADKVNEGSPRFKKWSENLSRLGEGVIRLQVDLLHSDAPSRILAVNEDQAFSLVFIDVPCSNTGVIRKHPDIRWRLQPEDVSRLTSLQGRLLVVAASLVGPGGRLVYSTCSLEEEENAGVVHRFLESPTGGVFRLVDHRHGFPWRDGHDGAGAFLLERLSRSD